jgi:hypothetical protein
MIRAERVSKIEVNQLINAGLVMCVMAHAAQ